MLRHKMETKQQEHIKHKPKKQAKYKKHYCFPRMSSESEMSDCSISWKQESTETEGEIIFGNDYVDRLYQDEPLAPPNTRLDVEDDEETDQDGLSQAVFEAKYLRQVAVESW